VATAFIIRGLPLPAGTEVTALPGWLVASATAIGLGGLSLALFEGALLCESAALRLTAR
jgi:hypothetical protein